MRWVALRTQAECIVQGVQAYDAEGCPENLSLYVEAGLGHSESVAMDNAVRTWLDKHLMVRKDFVTSC